MRIRSEPTTILIFEPDMVLGQVLAKVLARTGRVVVHAVTAAEALYLAKQHAPRVALLDCCLRDGKGLELAADLHTCYAGLPLVLVDADALRPDTLPGAKQLIRGLRKPLDLLELRRTVDAALDGPTPGASAAAGTEAPTQSDFRGLERKMTMQPTTPSTPVDPNNGQPPAVTPVPAPAPQVESVAQAPLWQRLVSGLIVFGILLAFSGYVLGVQFPGLYGREKDDRAKEDKDKGLSSVAGVALVKGQAHTLEVPEEVRTTLGIRRGKQDLVTTVQAPTGMPPLTLAGSTALDPTRLARIRARFAPARVVSISKIQDLDPKTGQTSFRELRPGDRVRKGDVLAVFYSVDVGSKKNDLLDALVQLILDQKILDEVEKHREAVPEVFYITQVRAVQGDRNAISRALNNLEVWDIPQDEIDALHEEAKKIAADKDAWYKTREGRWVKGEKQAKKDNGNSDKREENPWGRVTLRAPFDGVIVERNLHVDEMMVDGTVNLFQIADVNRLLVIANAPEDQLPTLEGLDPSQRRWSIRTVGATSADGLQGPIEEIGYLIDPNQHTAVIKGYVENPKQRLRAGQYVSATVRIPPPEGVVEIPVSALVDDGKQSLVFVQADPAKPHYTMRRVEVTHRFDQRAFVRSRPIPKKEPSEKDQGLLPIEALRPGERVLLAGVGELKAALLNLESQAEKERKEPKER